MASRKYNSDMGLAIYTIRISEPLKHEIGRAADSQNVSMNEYIARVMANHLKKPHLAVIPRKPNGRPRKEMCIA